MCFNAFLFTFSNACSSRTLSLPTSTAVSYTHLSYHLSVDHSNIVQLLYLPKNQPFPHKKKNCLLDPRLVLYLSAFLCAVPSIFCFHVSYVLKCLFSCFIFEHNQIFLIRRIVYLNNLSRYVSISECILDVY